jgi:hypothetical protein
MGDATSAPATGRVAQWIEEQLSGVDVSGLKASEASFRLSRYRAALERHSEVIDGLLTQYRKVIPIVLPDDEVLFVAKPGNGAAAIAHRRFIDEAGDPKVTSSEATLAYASSFVVHPSADKARELFDEWPMVPDRVATVANELCGAGARRLGK